MFDKSDDDDLYKQTMLFSKLGNELIVQDPTADRHYLFSDLQIRTIE
jgi:hypothetical protein